MFHPYMYPGVSIKFIVDGGWMESYPEPCSVVLPMFIPKNPFDDAEG